MFLLSPFFFLSPPLAPLAGKVPATDSALPPTLTGKEAEGPTVVGARILYTGQEPVGVGRVLRNPSQNLNLK